MLENNHCVVCNAEFVSDGFVTGYGTCDNISRICFTCCGLIDQWSMLEGKPITLYLHDESNNVGRFGQYKGKLTNWPGTLSIPIYALKKGRHNIARTRYDVWFSYHGIEWHGVQYGDNTQLCHCKPLKAQR